MQEYWNRLQSVPGLVAGFVTVFVLGFGLAACTYDRDYKEPRRTDRVCCAKSGVDWVTTRAQCRREGGGVVGWRRCRRD